MPTKKRTTKSTSSATTPQRQQRDQHQHQQHPTPTNDQANTATALSGPFHRSTQTHIFFYGGVLSNWNQTQTFSGARCLDLLLPSLSQLDIPFPLPARDALTTRLMAAHMFSCGEQWMMATKAWLFEREDSQQLAGEGEDFHRLRTAVYKAQPPTEPKERAVWERTVCAVLRATKPAVQKALGRRVRGFDELVWSRVSGACVVAACVARAERDPVLREIYLVAGAGAGDGDGRAFVEGSPRDRIWGVGLHWTDPDIENPESWAGENRLGRCHDQAAKMIREMYAGSAS